MDRIRFSFSVEKFADAMALLADQVHDLTTLKAVKLLYLADREHLLRYGRPILGDWYACMEQGPVPSRAYELLKQVRDPEPTVPLRGIDVVRSRIEARKGRRYAQFKRHGTLTLSALSKSETTVLNETLKKFGHKKVRDLVNITHQHVAWKKSDASGDHVMDYRAFFEDAPGHEDMRELMEEEQTDRDFISRMTAKQ